MLLGGQSLTRREMKTLITSDLWDAIRIWKDFKRFGLPHGVGIAGENAEVISLIRSFEETYEDVQAAAYNKVG